jgi:acyl-CoA thioesterase FadM
VPLKFELEYFMAFYGSFSIGYSMVFLFRTTFEPRFTAFTQTTLVSYAAFSAGVFGLGYLYSLPVLMIIGSVLPLAHATAVILTRRAVEEISKSGVMERVADAAREAIEKHDIRGVVKKFTHDSREAAVERAATEANAAVMLKSLPDPSPNVASISGGGSCWIEGKWFVHTMTATYQDTNSVGNVYFAQYAMWVGKTRELFFNHCLPEFDLRTTPWYILTRMFEHKFLRESREFEQIQIKIRVSDFNRKFVTMEHQVFDSQNMLLGKGKQVLLFVSSANYQIIDIPADCHKAFIPYIA